MACRGQALSISSGSPDDQAGEFLGLIIGQPLVRDGDGVRRLAIHMRQRQAIGIDHPIATRDSAPNCHG